MVDIQIFSIPQKEESFSILVNFVVYKIFLAAILYL